MSDAFADYPKLLAKILVWSIFSLPLLKLIFVQQIAKFTQKEWVKKINYLWKIYDICYIFLPWVAILFSTTFANFVMKLVGLAALVTTNIALYLALKAYTKIDLSWLESLASHLHRQRAFWLVSGLLLMAGSQVNQWWLQVIIYFVAINLIILIGYAYHEQLSNKETVSLLLWVVFYPVFIIKLILKNQEVTMFILGSLAALLTNKVLKISLLSNPAFSVGLIIALIIALIYQLVECKHNEITGTIALAGGYVSVGFFLM